MQRYGYLGHYISFRCFWHNAAVPGTHLPWRLCSSKAWACSCSCAWFLVQLHSFVPGQSRKQCSTAKKWKYQINMGTKLPHHCPATAYGETQAARGTERAEGQRRPSCLASALSEQSGVTLTRKELRNNWQRAERKAFCLLKVSRTTLFAQMERLSVFRKNLRILERNIIDDTWHFPSLLSQNRQSLFSLILLRPHRRDCIHFSSSTWAGWEPELSCLEAGSLYTASTRASFLLTNTHFRYNTKLLFWQASLLLTPFSDKTLLHGRAFLVQCLSHLLSRTLRSAN